MTSVDREFLWRWSRVPFHGLGLSVDVYSPDLFELLAALEARGLGYGYLEIFKAAHTALTLVRQRLPDVLLVMPSAAEVAAREASELRAAFQEANELICG